MHSEHRTRELTILNTVAQALNRSIDLDEALQAALAKSAELLDLHAGWIWLLNEETGEHYLAASQNLPPALAEKPERMEGWCYCVEQYFEGTLAEAANIDIITCSRLKNYMRGTDGLRFHASVPLNAHGKQIGILNVASSDWCELAPEDLSLLYTIGDMLGIAIERARLYERGAELGAERERNRLAREIHDTLAQGFSAIALQLEAADALIESDGDRMRIHKAVQQALFLARANLEEARRSVMDLRAAPLDGRTLVAALAHLAGLITARNEVRVSFSAVGASRPLPTAMESGLYRVAQEALSNVVQHASARTATLTLAITPDQVSLNVQDDGQGFEPNQIKPQRYGLIGMNERLKLLGGSLKIASEPGRGTRVEAVVPFHQSISHDSNPRR